MVYKKLPSNFATTLRNAGLTVVEVEGWQNRGRPASTGELDPVGVLCHHTATGPKTSNGAVVNLLVKGRSDLPGPLCHFGLARNGTVYLVAAGRANHAGKAKKSGSVAAGDGNKLYWGIEAFNDGRGEKWSEAQLNAYALLCAVISAKLTKNSAQTVRGHKETSVTGKIDPTFDMTKFRDRVQSKINQLTATKPVASVNGIKAPAPAPKAWASFVHLDAKGYMDYVGAVKEAAARKTSRAVDIDVQKSKDGTLWALHWNNIARNGLADPLKKIPSTALVSDLTDQQILRLRSSSGKKAHTINYLLELAWSHRVRVELEFKVRISTLAARALMADPQVAALHAAKLLQTKVIAKISSPHEKLAPLQEAGFVTLLSFGGYTGPGLRRSLLWPVTDYTRGDEKWI